MEQPDDVRSLAIGTASLMEKFALLLLFSLLLAGVYLVLKPFLLGLVFGAILAVAAWPLRSWLIARGLSGAVAAGVMLTLLMVFVLAPMAVAAPGLAVGVKQLAEQGIGWINSSPQLPIWISELPFVGSKIAATWQGLLAQTPESKAMLMSYVQPARQFITDAALGLAASRAGWAGGCETALNSRPLSRSACSSRSACACSSNRRLSTMLPHWGHAAVPGAT